ncbi:MAG TPA: hypothetical protein VKX49_12785 [Bryobacteraceae bacterium]|nr:hypothetical protein [Bryobacteraceae bacterium]
MNWQEWLHIAGSVLTAAVALGVYLIKRKDEEEEGRRAALLELAVTKAVNAAREQIMDRVDRVKYDISKQLEDYISRNEFEREFKSIRGELRGQSDVIKEIARRQRP